MKELATRKVVAAIALAAFTATVAACGSDSSDKAAATATSGAASSNASKAATGDPILLYGEASVDTPTTNQPDIQYGLDAAITAINNAGGINGKPLKLDFCNDKYVPAEEIACARKAVASKDVAGVAVSHTGSQSQLPIFKAAGFPLVGGNGDSSDFQDPIQFPTSGGAAIDYVGLPVAMKKAGVTKVALVSYNIPAGKPFTDGVASAVKASGLEVAGIVAEPPSGTTDFSPYAQKIKGMGVNGVIFITNVSIAAGNMRAVKALGLDVKFGHTSASVGDAEAKSLGSVADGLIVASDLPPNSSADKYPAVKQYLAELDAIKAPQEWRRGVGMNAWLAVYALSDVLKSIKGEITRDSVKQALDAWPASTPISVKGLYDWNPAQNGPYKLLPRLTNDKLFVAEVQGGKLILSSTPPFNVFPALGVQ